MIQMQYECTINGVTFSVQREDNEVVFAVENDIKETLMHDEEEQAEACYDDFRVALQHIGRALKGK